MSIKINQSQLNKVLKAVDDAFAEVVVALDNEFHAVIEDPNEFSDLGLDNQDIIDTGRFNNSQILNVSKQGGKTVANYEWNPSQSRNWRTLRRADFNRLQSLSSRALDSWSGLDGTGG